ncbi:calcium-binding protein [Streptomyces sp. enrichment culture]|uniref:calcium-binding protein n=1 Tax=Streptomyces sp. enrichment culture TaxID=1795815 RepID=UPI003F54F7FF
MARAGTVAATVLALVLTLPGTAVAAPGDLDPTFGGDGTVLTTLADTDRAADVALQPDGKIVSVGYSSDESLVESRFALTRHHPDGSLDQSFGAGGTVATPINNMEPNLQWSEAAAVALQADGKIVVVGHSWREYENCCWFVVARYNPDGSLDDTFSGDGRVFADIAGPTDALDVAIDSQNRIVAAGYTGGHVALARYLGDGTPDSSFGGDGVVTADPVPGSLEAGGGADGMALQPDGKIVIGGDVGSTRFDFMLMRFHTDGSVDTGFDGDGIVRTDFGDYDGVEEVVIQPDGKIVAAGGSGGRFALARYLPDGSLDTGFDGDGKVLTTGGGGASDVVLQGDGRIVVAGSNGPGGDFAVLRYNPDGSQDTGFGTGGVATADFGGADAAYGVALQPDGRIVAVGQGGPGSDFALARFEGGGTPPPPPPVNPDLSVTKTGTSTVNIGDRATYTITVSNTTAGTTATGVTLSDTLSGPAATVISATTTQGSCTTTATTVSCTLGSVTATTPARVTLVVEPRATGTLTDRVTISSTSTDPDSTDNSATKTTTVGNSRGCTRIGTSGNDTLTGTTGADVICTLGGDDTVNASYGNDTVHGGFGNDRLDGGYHDDRLVGGPGSDYLIGNYGNDRLDTVDSVSGNDSANGGSGYDTCTTDSGDTRISCP